MPGRHVIGAEEGFTLVELLLASVIGLIIIGSAVSLFTTAIRTEPRIGDRTAAIQQGRTMSERISRELRQGSDVQSASPSQLMILTYVPRSSCGAAATGPGIRCRVFYNVDSNGTGTRQECPLTTLVPPTGCGAAVQVVSGLMDNNVFAFTPKSPGHGFVSIRLAYPAVGAEDAITIEDGVALRNPPVGSSG